VAAHDTVGGTYGLPLIWAFAVLAVSARRVAQVREVFALAIVYWLLCAATNIDMGTSHRYALGPGLLLVAVAIGVASREYVTAPWVRRSAVVVVVLSALQILRSATLYLSRM
jgi:hypothetical protein